jgi:hypothetical protein
MTEDDVPEPKPEVKNMSFFIDRSVRLYFQTGR